MRISRTARWLAVPLSLALATAACTSDSSSDSGPDGTTSGTTVGGSGGAPVATLTSADVDAAVAQLDDIVGETMDATGVPGVSVAVVYDDEVVVTRTYGVRSTETEEPIDEDTIFQIASLSKPVSGSIVSGLVGDGALEWDDPVEEANPDFELSDPWVSEHVTYADLFSMRTGLPGLAGNLLEAIGYDRDTIIARLALVELVGGFRDSYSYSNFGLTSGGVLAADTAGMTWEEAADEVLFGPAGMDATSYEFTDYEAAENKALAHAQVDGEWQPAFTREPDAQAPAGGISTTIGDMATWSRIMLNDGALGDEQLIDPEALTQMVTPHLNTRPPVPPLYQSGGYALGMNVGLDAQGNARWNHSGAFSTGTATTAVFLPAQDLGIVVLTNAQPVGASEAITDAFMELATTGEITQDWVTQWTTRMAGVYGEPEDIGEAPADPTPPADAAAYAGTYTNEYVGDIEIQANDTGGLTMVMGPAEVAYELTPFDGDTFTFAFGPELPDFLSAVTFTMGPDGTATAVNVSTFDDVGWGDFTRV